MNLLWIQVVILVAIFKTSQSIPATGVEVYQAQEWRLTGGTTPNEGRVEVRIQETDPSVWHTVCSDSFADSLSPLLCVTLGFPYIPLPCSTKIPPATELPDTDLGQILKISTSVCQTNVKSLEECIFVGFTNATSDSCTHDNDTWIRCFTGSSSDIEVRLVDGLFPSEGFVQTRCPNSTWSTVCGGHWDPRDANVVCKQLGFPYAYATTPMGMLSTDLGEVVVNNVFCNGEENTFGECRLGNFELFCFGGAPGVQCSEYYEAGGISLPICGQHRCAHPLSSDLVSNPRDYCKCDCVCLFFDDCCPDFDLGIDCPVERQSNFTINNIDIDYYDCIGVPGSERNNYGLVLVSKCPEEWTDINTRLNCEIERDTSDVVGLIPVHDSDKVVYKNIFCALCHGKSLADVTFWTVKAQTTWGGPGFTDTDLGISIPWAGAFLGYNVIWPDESVRPRSCLLDFVDSCPSDFGDENLVSACQSYHAPIYFSQLSYPGYPKPYKNLHCALCNGVPEDLFRAACDGQCEPEHCSVDAPEDMCNPHLCAGPGDRFLTVEALFSFTDFQMDAYGIPNSCSEGDVYDPFLKQCRSLACPPDFILVANICKPRDSPDPKITEADVIGTEFSKNALACMLHVTGFNSSSSTGATQIVTTERQQAIRSCSAEDTGCDITDISTAILTLVFREPVELAKFVKSVNTTLADHTSAFVCNVTSVEILISYSDKYALPSHCGRFANNSSEIYNITDSSHQILMYASFDFDAATMSYSSSFAARTCLFNTDLNCSTIVSLNQSEYTIMTSNDDIIQVFASNITIPSEEYILLVDGTVLICSTSQFPMPSRVTRTAVDIAAYVCSWLSVIALTATLITYLMFKPLRNLAGKAVINLVIALLLAYIGLQLQGFLLINAGACTAWAILTHFFWIGAFTWMAVFAFNIARTFSRRSVQSSSDGGSFVKYFCIGWAIPSIIIGVTFALHFCNCTSITFHYGSVEENTCFLRSSVAVMYAVVVPISVLLFLSMGFFLFMAIQLHTQRSASKIARTGGTLEEMSFEAVIYLRLSGVIGATWIFAYLYFLIPDSIVVSYIYNILNSLQGVFIFLAFGCTRRVRNMWVVKFQGTSSGTKSTGISTGKSLSEKKARGGEVLDMVSTSAKAANDHADTNHSSNANI